MKKAYAYMSKELAEMGVPTLNSTASFFIWADFRKVARAGHTLTHTHTHRKTQKRTHIQGNTHKNKHTQAHMPTHRKPKADTHIE